jgi:hypothetical protein
MSVIPREVARAWADVLAYAPEPYCAAKRVEAAAFTAGVAASGKHIAIGQAQGRAAKKYIHRRSRHLDTDDARVVVGI